MAENFQLSPEDRLCVLNLSKRYRKHVLLKACCEAYPSFHPQTLKWSLNSSGLGELSSSTLDYPTASNLSQKRSIDAQSGQDYALEAAQHPSLPLQYKPFQDYEAFKRNSIASPATSQITHLDINSSTIAQPTLQQNTKTQRLAAKFFCTFCAENGKLEKNRYGTKSDWKKHLTKFHETGEEFLCSICAEGFKRYCDLCQHFRESHSDQPTPPATDIRVQKLAFGCGFLKCKTVLSAWEEWCKHVAEHMERGGIVSQWCYSTVIRNLLRQEGICDDAKAFLTQACNKWHKDRSELKWRPENSITKILRQKLECCNFGSNRDAFLEWSFRTGFNMQFDLPVGLGIPSFDSISEHDTLNIYEPDDIPTNDLSNSYSTSQFEITPPEYQLASLLAQPQLGSTTTDAAQLQTPNHELSLNAIPHHVFTSTSLDPAIHLDFKLSSQFQHHHHHQQQQQSNTEPRNSKKISAPKHLMDGFKRSRVPKKSQRSQTAVSRNAQIINGAQHQPSGDQNPNFPFADPPSLSGLPGSIPTPGSARHYRDGTRIPQYLPTQSRAPIATDEVMQGADNVLSQHNAFQARQQVPPGARSASDRSRQRAIKAAAPSRNLGGDGTVHNLS